MPAEMFQSWFSIQGRRSFRQCPSASFEEKVYINALIFSMLFQSSLYVVIPVFIFIPLIKKSGEGLIPLGNLVLIKHVL